MKNDANKGGFVLFSKKYTKLEKTQIPTDSRLHPLNHRENQLQNYDVLLLHRTLSTNFGIPSEFDWEPGEKIDKTTIRGNKTEWQYYIKTKTGDLIKIASRDRHTAFILNYVTPVYETQPSPSHINAGKRFVDDLLTEIKRLENALINEDEHFSHSINVQFYFIDNVYLQNYMCGEFLLNGTPAIEASIANEVLKHDAREKKVRSDAQKMRHLQKHIMLKGVFWGSIISYFFMAFEGFLNMLYYSFLKDEHRKNGFKFSVNAGGKQKLIDIHYIDIESKLRQLPLLCDGLNEKRLDSNTPFMKDFRELKIYRNKLFHSSLKDNLKRICVTQDDFLYDFDVDQLRKTILPSRRHNLTQDDVKKVKMIIDTTIQNVVNLFEDKFQKAINKFILSDLSVPFIQDGFGNVRLPEMDEFKKKVEDF